MNAHVIVDMILHDFWSNDQLYFTFPTVTICPIGRRAQSGEGKKRNAYLEIWDQSQIHSGRCTESTKDAARSIV